MSVWLLVAVKTRLKRLAEEPPVCVDRSSRQPVAGKCWKAMAMELFDCELMCEQNRACVAYEFNEMDRNNLKCTLYENYYTLEARTDTAAGIRFLTCRGEV